MNKEEPHCNEPSDYNCLYCPDLKCPHNLERPVHKEIGKARPVKAHRIKKKQNDNNKQ